jgi:hypothetical protein
LEALLDEFSELAKTRFELSQQPEEENAGQESEPELKALELQVAQESQGNYPAYKIRPHASQRRIWVAWRAECSRAEFSVLPQAGQ